LSIINEFEPSILIIVKDEPSISDTLTRLKSHSSTMQFECVVVDASEGRLDFIRKSFPWVKWIDFISPKSKKISIPEQRNVAVRASTGKFIAFCDAGGIPDPHWLDNLMAPLFSGEFSLVGGPILNSNTASPTSQYNLQPYGTKLQVKTTANLAMSRDVYLQVGGFRESLEYGSDADFIWRAEQLGILHASIPSAVMSLNGGTSSREIRRSWRYGKAMTNLFSIHKDKRANLVRNSPEIIFYPMLILATIIGISLRPARLAIPTLSIFLAANCAIVVKNRRGRRPYFTLVLHYVYALGMLSMLIKLAIKRIR